MRQRRCQCLHEQLHRQVGVQKKIHQGRRLHEQLHHRAGVHVQIRRRWGLAQRHDRVVGDRWRLRQRRSRRGRLVHDRALGHGWELPALVARNARLRSCATEGKCGGREKTDWNSPIPSNSLLLRSAPGQLSVTMLRMSARRPLLTCFVVTRLDTEVEKRHGTSRHWRRGDRAIRARLNHVPVNDVTDDGAVDAGDRRKASDDEVVA